jgi:hypothetical protein
MESSTPIDTPEVAAVFADFPEPIRDRLLELRELVISTADETEGVTGFAEALRWGEPSFVTKSGSTVRMNQKSPTEYALYFNCQSKLVDTFRELFPTTFRFEGNRALVFTLEDPLPQDELRMCLSIALTYHKRKHLNLLGA